MGIADRDYMRERHREARAHPGRPGPPEPSATSTLWYILFFLSIAFLGYKAASWWDSTHPKGPKRPAPHLAIAPAAPVAARGSPVPEPRQRIPGVNPNLTGSWDANRPMAPNAPAPTPAATTIVIKCVINGVTTYADSESDCLARAKATVVTIHARQNLSDGLPSAPQIIQRPSPMAQLDAAPTGPDPNIQRQALCQSYEQEIKWMDERARQPLSGQEQDWLAAKRKKARDEQFRLHC
jgi:hypothetical protein